MKTAAQRLTFSKRGRPRNVKTEHLTTTRQKAVAEHEVWCLWQASAQWGTPATLDSLHSSSTQCLTGFWPGTQGPQRMGSAGTVAQVSLQISDLIQHSMALELLLFQIVVRFPSLNSGANLTSTWERRDWFVVNKLAFFTCGRYSGWVLVPKWGLQPHPDVVILSSLWKPECFPLESHFKPLISNLHQVIQTVLKYPVAMLHTEPQILVSKHHSSIKGIKAPWRNADSRTKEK